MYAKKLHGLYSFNYSAKLIVKVACASEFYREIKQYYLPIEIVVLN